MDAKFKHEWDYLGWKTYGSDNIYSQKDWNQTVLTKINQTSAQIFKESFRGGANRIFVHPKTFCLIKDLEYFNYNGTEGFLSGRFKVIIDETIDQDTIYVKHVDEVFENMKIKLGKPNLLRGFKITKDNPDSMQELTFKFIELGEDIDDFKVITEEMLTGEIKILNFTMIDPVTGELVIDYHNEIPENIWVDKHPNENEFVGIRPLTTDEHVSHLSKKLESFKQHPHGELFVNTIQRQIDELEKPKIKKPWYKRLIEFFNSKEQVKIENVKDSTININIR